MNVDILRDRQRAPCAGADRNHRVAHSRHFAREVDHPPGPSNALPVNTDASHRDGIASPVWLWRTPDSPAACRDQRLVEVQLVDHLGDVEREAHAFAAMPARRLARLAQSEQPDRAGEKVLVAGGLAPSGRLMYTLRTPLTRPTKFSSIRNTRSGGAVWRRAEKVGVYFLRNSRIYIRLFHEESQRQPLRPRLPTPPPDRVFLRLDDVSSSACTSTSRGREPRQPPEPSRRLGRAVRIAPGEPSDGQTWRQRHELHARRRRG